MVPRIEPGPNDLFKFLSQVTDMYKYCRVKIVSYSMLTLVYK